MFTFALNKSPVLAHRAIGSKPQHVDLDAAPASIPLQPGILLTQGFGSKLLVISAA